MTKMFLLDETVMIDTVTEATEKWINKLIKNEWKCRIAFKESDEKIQGIITKLADGGIMLHEIELGKIGKEIDTFDLSTIKSISMIENDYYVLR